MSKIFISKKEDDQIIAKRLREELKSLLGQDVEMVMSQDIPSGADWREWIREQLTTTDLLILLITDPARPLDWCMYEVGLYEPLSERPPKPIVCLYPEGEKMPIPIEHLQGVECSKDKLKIFLRDLFGGKITGAPINRVMAEDDKSISKLSEELYHILSPNPISESERVYYTRHISITLNITETDDSKIPLDSKVSGDELSFEIFQLEKTQPSGKPWTWGDLRPFLSKAFDEAGSNPDESLNRLEISMLEACKGIRIAPLEGYIRSLTSMKKYRLVIHRRDFFSEGKFRVRILLVQEPEPDSGERNRTFPTRPG